MIYLNTLRSKDKSKAVIMLISRGNVAQKGLLTKITPSKWAVTLNKEQLLGTFVVNQILSKSISRGSITTVLWLRLVVTPLTSSLRRCFPRVIRTTLLVYLFRTARCTVIRSGSHSTRVVWSTKSHLSTVALVSPTRNLLMSWPWVLTGKDLPRRYLTHRMDWRCHETSKLSDPNKMIQLIN